MADRDRLEEYEDYELERFEPLTEAPEDEEAGEKDGDIETGTEAGANTGGETNEEFTDTEDNEPELSLSDLGKIYVLRNIYLTLNTLYTYSEQLLIKNNYDERILKIQETIQELKELFLLIAYNLDKYLDKLDSIIDLLQKAIKLIATELENYDKQNSNDDRSENSKESK